MSDNKASAVSALSAFVLGAIKGAAKTTHPSGKVDDGTTAASTGARAAENTADVKKTGVGPTVDGAKPSEAAGGDKGVGNPLLHHGVEAGATGDVPGPDTASAKKENDDAPTSHPATTAGKKQASEVASGIVSTLARIAVLTEKAASATPSTSTPTPPPAPAATPTPTAEEKAAADARAAGAAAADAAAQALELTPEQLGEGVRTIVKNAEHAADLACDMILGFAKAAAMDPAAMDPAAMQAAPGGVPPGMDGAPAPEAGGDISEEELLQLCAEAGITPEELVQMLQEIAAAQGGEAGAAPGAAPEPAPAPEPPPEAKAAAAKVAQVKEQLRSALAKFKQGVK